MKTYALPVTIDNLRIMGDHVISNAYSVRITTHKYGLDGQVIVDTVPSADYCSVYENTNHTATARTIYRFEDRYDACAYAIEIANKMARLLYKYGETKSELKWAHPCDSDNELYRCDLINLVDGDDDVIATIAIDEEYISEAYKSLIYGYISSKKNIA